MKKKSLLFTPSLRATPFAGRSNLLFATRLLRSRERRDLAMTVGVNSNKNSPFPFYLLSFTFYLLLLLSPTLLYSQKNLSLIGNLPYATVLSDIWGYVDTAGNEYALVGLYTGVSVVNVSDPANPRQVFFTSAASSEWREIKTWKKHAYITNETGSGLMIIDMSGLPQDSNLPVSYHTGTSYPFTTAHTLFIDSSGVCYILGANYGNKGVIMLDLNANPKIPAELGIFNNYYIHDGMVKNDTLWAAAINNGFFSVIDVKNKSNPVILAQQSTGPPTQTHNCWLSDDSRYLFTTDEQSGAFIASYDVSNLGAITLLDKVQSSPGTGVIPHNTYYLNGYLINSYYRDGVVIHDAARPKNLIETGNYDTSPYSGNGSNGCWGVYPWLPSGNIIASDMENGLFILKPKYSRACYLEGNVTNNSTASPLGNVFVEILSTTASTATDISGNFALGTADSGSYNVRFSKPGFLSKTISNNVLSNGIVTLLNVALDTAIPFTLNGKVIRTTGDSLPGTLVKIEGQDSLYNISSDSTGNFIINPFYKDNYTITCGKWEYITKCFTQSIDSSITLTITLDTGIYDDFSFDFGWTVTGNASPGMWERAKPIGTNFEKHITQVANPVSDAGSDCSVFAYVTGNGGGTADFDDVDKGVTKLTSPVINLLSYPDPYITYYRWFFNGGSNGNPNDSFVIKLNDTHIDLVTFKDAVQMSKWVYRVIKVSDFIALSDSVRFGAEASDRADSDHIAEAGMDVIRIYNGGAPPKAEFFSDTTNVCKGDSVLFFTLPSGNQKFQWNFPGGTPASDTALAPVVKYDSIGSFDVQLIDTDSLFGSDTLTKQKYITVSVPCSTAVKEFPVSGLGSAERFLVYPNPFTDGFHVFTGSAKNAGATFLITDLAGRELYTAPMDPVNPTTFIKPRLMDGVYIGIIRSNNGNVEYFKIVKTNTWDSF